MNTKNLAVNPALDEVAVARHVRRLASELAEIARPIAHWGDGNGSEVLRMVETALRETGAIADLPARDSKKKKIAPGVRRFVLERDKYRCVQCGTHVDLGLDHIHPESLGGESTPENLQTMCRSCNSKKGTAVASAA